jgi:putative two-component system response regulator
MEQATILVVDDDPELRQVLEESLTALGYRVSTAESGEAALDMISHREPDLVLSDVHMTPVNGIELCRALKADPRWQLIPVILLTAVGDLQARVAGLDAGADDFFTKPYQLLELRTRLAALLRVKALVDQLERAESIITTLGLTIEARDPYTGGHCERLARYAVALGKALGVDQPTLRALRLAGFLHDLGKIAVPDAILLKPGPLDHAERSRIQLHPVVGADLLKGMKTLEAVRPMVRHHHERFDGSGYPDRLAGEGIPIGARIMAVVDVYDALVTARSYKPALPPIDAIAILSRETNGGAWDPRVVTALLDILKEAPGSR